VTRYHIDTGVELGGIHAKRHAQGTLSLTLYRAEKWVSTSWRVLMTLANAPAIQPVECWAMRHLASMPCGCTHGKNCDNAGILSRQIY
jgi:hypothetical protein